MVRHQGQDRVGLRIHREVVMMMAALHVPSAHLAHQEYLEMKAMPYHLPQVKKWIDVL